jgi:hypothetical protein
VLISQGVDVPPVFSDTVSLAQVNSNYGFTSPNGTVNTKQGVMDMIRLRQKPFGALGDMSSFAQGAYLVCVEDSPTNVKGEVITVGGGPFLVMAIWTGSEWIVV